jgi:hypothetical protein
MDGELIAMLLAAHFCGSALEQRLRGVAAIGKDIADETEQKGRQNAKNIGKQPTMKARHWLRVSRHY